MSPSTQTISLTTDFGTQDGFVGIVKGVILAIAPQAKLIDISHEIPSWDVAAASWIIWNAERFLPERAVHLCVVDPGVGSPSQRGTILTNGRARFVGPDNGIFSRLLENKNEEWTAFELTNSEFWRPVVSTSFQARDIYAPVCARLVQGEPLSSFGARVELDSLKRLPVPPLELGGGGAQGAVIYIDKFGNLITNVPSWAVQLGHRFFVEEQLVGQVATTYASVEIGTAIAFVGSHGTLEIAVRQGNAASQLGAHVGTRVRLEPPC